ncbi:hypothetical protein SAMN05444354_11630 [Stigmatella aurantiaca]|uniref:Lipoprotein n=1 Tax=Stigmatella aurantiaca TaxID=41 RepID=A0A1H7Y0A3_STIAU|nr:hypothetical protein [Stigmatella aurantiaca]SEM39646.1 hypothetical protein SAMN05444354_11630 [Stigmatella aurantiaca]
MKVFSLFLSLAVASLGCSHAQPKVNHQIYVISDEAPGIGGSSEHDCGQEQVDCFERCWNADDRPYPHVKRDEWYYKYCTKKCREEYLECIKEREKTVQQAPKLTFTRMDSALDWLREHKTELIIGTVVLIAGVAFLIVIGGTGALLLVPAAI